MAPNSARIYFVLTFAVLFMFFVSFCSCFRVKSFNHSHYDFLPAVATWYGDPTGAGSGGACGFENDVALPPFSAMISAGNQVLYKHGKGCGTCFQVQCTENPACSGIPVTVTITDECPGTCNDDPVHFDLSGTAFGALAKTGLSDQLRKAGRIDVVYQRVPCNYPHTPIVFKVDKGSNPYYFSFAIEYENGDGDLALVEIQPAGSNQWFPMHQVWGATFKYDVPQGTTGPYSIRLTQGESKETLVAKNVIPFDWKPGKVYRSLVNFKAIL